MGGPGSGNRIRTFTRPTVEANRPLDVRYLARVGALLPGTCSELSGERWGSALLVADDGRVRLRYDDGTRMAVDLESTPCTFGGSRPWFVCPRCGRRCAVLHETPGTVGCRLCLRLVYSSTRGGPLDRLLDRWYAAHRRLGGTGGLFDCPRRPKGMRRRTYARLRDAWYEAKMAALGGALRADGWDGESDPAGSWVVSV